MVMRLAMIVRRLAISGTVILTVLLRTALPQTAVVGKNCDLAVLGANEAKTFLAFDRELRSALSKQDAGMMALLVRNPLRINDDRGSYYVEDAASLQGRFHDIFPPAVRQAVLNERPEAIECSYRGIMYGDGVVWVNPTNKGYLIWTINLPAASRSTRAAVPGNVEFACETKQHRVIVDIGAQGAPRYRAWNKPRPLTEEPSMEVTQGKRTFEGTGPCAHPVWTFTRGSTTFIVEGMDCSSDSDPPPDGANGRLEVLAGDRPEATWWCF